MIPIRQRVETTHALEGYPREVRAIFEKAGRAYVDKLGPRHFQRTAYQEYGYEYRESGYGQRKQRAFGHRRPLEFTGETRRAAARAAVRLMGHIGRPRAAIVMDLPSYITSDAERRSEIEATSTRDARVLAELIEKDLTRALRRRTPKRRI